MEPRVSVIVPVYNADSYLSECLDSVLRQSFSDFEVIVVDDGSTDKSGYVCDTYAKRDKRIRVYHVENGGVSSARNTALDYAKGEYVIFLDADDFWTSDDCLETLVNEAVLHDADIVRGEYIAVDEAGGFLFEKEINSKKSLCANKKISSVAFLNDAIQGEFFLVLSLIRYEKIGRIRFNKQQVFLEDMDFYSRLLLQPMACVFVPIRFYAYRKISTSASAKPSIKKLADSFGMCDNFDKYALQAGDEALKQYFGYRSVMMYYWTLDTVASDVYYSDRRQIVSELGLRKIWRSSVRRLWKYKVLNKAFPIILFPPLLGVFCIRLKNWLVGLKK